MSDNKLEVESSTFYLGKLSNIVRTNNQNEQDNEENNDDDDEEYNDDDYNEGDFDEKDELEVALTKMELSNTKKPDNLNNNSSNTNLNASYDSMDALDNDEVDSKLSDAKQLKSISKSYSHNNTGKSTFYFAESASESVRITTEEDNDLVYLPRSYFDERLVFSLKNVNCVYSTTNRNDIPNVCGKLLLTNYRLIFLPYEADKQNIDAEIWSRMFVIDNRLQLFNHKKLISAIIIPYAFIYELRACKYRFL
jgi:hypothetical protein